MSATTIDAQALSAGYAALRDHYRRDPSWEARVIAGSGEHAETDIQIAVRNSTRNDRCFVRLQQAITAAGYDHRDATQWAEAIQAFIRYGRDNA